MAAAIGSAWNRWGLDALADSEAGLYPYHSSVVLQGNTYTGVWER